MKKYSNPCTRCGKERIVAKRWVEEIPTVSGTKIEVTHTSNICPDPECQKVVEKELAAAQGKRDKIKADREKRVVENLANKKLAAEKKLAEFEESSE
jgi:hypothetical protein